MCIGFAGVCDHIQGEDTEGSLSSHRLLEIRKPVVSLEHLLKYLELILIPFAVGNAFPNGLDHNRIY